MAKPSGLSPEVKERAIRLVREHQAKYASQYEAIPSMAGTIGYKAETMLGCVRHAERGTGERLGLARDERARMAALEREAKELRRANEILRKASAYFA